MNFPVSKHSMSPILPSQESTSLQVKPVDNLFAGRLGGNQAFTLDRDESANATTLQRLPDAAPLMSWSEQFDLRGFRRLDLWKAGLAEGVGKLKQQLLEMEAA